VAANRSQALSALLSNEGLSNLLHVHPTRTSPEYQTFLANLKAVRPDYFFCFSYSMIFTPEILDIARFGAINFHGGLLPQFRGANVCNWVFIEDAKESGMTAHIMTPRIDDGDIIFQEKVSISETDTAKTLKDKIDRIGFEMLRKIKSLLDEGRELPLVPQDERESKYYRRRRPQDGLIDWSKSDREIFNLVRALVSPWPGAFFYDKQGRKVILSRYHTIAEIRQLRDIYAS
jgi:UDP-4-amino-4-deoxy-L-arabinose formyltransferase/UDP-glucuronic acid dehydrogenase (UDP-4-keto-hexauronic acid decarboxylating)